MNNKNLGGFTLLELVIVITILALLSGIVVLNYDNVILKSKVKADYASSKIILSAIKMYEADSNADFSSSNVISDLGIYLAENNSIKSALDGEWNYANGKLTIKNYSSKDKLEELDLADNEKALLEID